MKTSVRKAAKTTQPPQQAEPETHEYPRADGWLPGAHVGRSLPHSDEAERCLLGCLLLNPEALSECAEKFGSASAEEGAARFYNENLGTIYATMAAMHNASEPIDMVTVTQKLAGYNQLERVGGAALIAQLTNAVPTAANVGFYLDIVCKRHRLRQVIQAGTQVVGEAYECSDDGVEELVAGGYNMFANIATTSSSRCRRFGDIAHEAIPRIEELIQSDDHLVGLSTGYYWLDRWTRGLWKGGYYLLAGLPSVGKTSLATCVAFNVARGGDGVAFFSCEQTCAAIVIRTLAAASGETITGVSNRSASDKAQAFSRVANAIQQTTDLNFWLDDTAAISTAMIRARLRGLVARHHVRLCVIDYAQLLRAEGRFKDKREEMVAISGQLKAMAKEFDIPFLVLAQLNREAQREKRRPRMSDLAESSALEKDADGVWLMSRWCMDDAPTKFDRDTLPTHIAAENPNDDELMKYILVQVAKNRESETGAAVLRFNKPLTRYENIETSYAQQPDSDSTTHPACPPEHDAEP